VIDAAIRDFTLSGEGAVLAFADYARAVLCNGLGRYQDALAAATATDAFEIEGVTICTQGPAELVEAATRTGAAERAADALARLEEMTRASDTDWGAGIRARSQALVSTDEASEPLYREAIERLSRTRIRPQLARATWSTASGCAGKAPRGRPSGAVAGVRDVHRHGDGRIFRAHLARAGGHRREDQGAGRGETARSHQPGGADRPARAQRTDEPGDRVPALLERAHRGMAPAQGLHQARDLVRRQLHTAVL